MVNINFVFKENKNEAVKQFIESIAGGVYSNLET